MRVRGHWNGVGHALAIGLVGAVVFLAISTPVVEAQGESVDPDEPRQGAFQLPDLRGTVCGPIDLIMGDAACTPIALFVAPLGLIGGLVFAGTRNPMLLSGAAALAMALASLVVLPSPILVGGFLLAAAGMGAIMLLIRR